ncbi:hypothetical protein MHU86_12791 [Fragilaria crotonensis]|nr:hypothetical protein MHU86_12791 [Fragilaria crotonensis]
MASISKESDGLTAATAAATSTVDVDAVRQVNWSGSIPIVLSLAPSSLSSPTMPNPIHVMVPRQSHLHVGLKDAVKRLHKFAPAVLSLSLSTNHSLVRNEPKEGEETEPSLEPETPSHTYPTPNQMAQEASTYPTCWFEDMETQTPLRWQLFAGVLWDLKPVPKKTLPWNIRLHFTQYPAATHILPLETDPHTAVKRAFKNSLKQALFLQHGSAKIAMNLSKQSHEQIWDSVLAVNYKLYQRVNDDLQTLHSNAKLLPIRVLIDSNPPIQKPINVADTNIVTLGDLLVTWAPLLFTNDSESDKASTATTTTLAQWTIQGIQNIPLSTTLADLWYALCHPDHFLYIIVTTSKSS